jgi:hypothetical protein
MRKEEIVDELNRTLDLAYPLNHWQFRQVRKYELQGLLERVCELKQEAEECKSGLEEGPDNRKWTIDRNGDVSVFR